MKSRRDLSGLDWMIQAMCHATRRKTGHGNVSQIVLEFDRVLDEALFRDTVARFSMNFPELAGRMARTRSLVPYWKVPPEAEIEPIRVEVLSLSSDEVSKTLETCVNTPFKHTCEYVVFYLLKLTNNRSVLAMTFDHRLMDARGAEQFLLFLNQYDSGTIKLERGESSSVSEDSGLLKNWKKKLSSGIVVMRTMQDKVIGSNMLRLTQKRKEKKGEGRFILFPLNDSESKEFMEKAYQEAGYLMFMPYALTAACSAYGRLSQLRERQGSFVVPCTVDLRGQESSVANLFFNKCSLLFFKIDPAESPEKSDVIASIKKQLYAQTKSGFPLHLRDFYSLMRILPVWLFDRMLCSGQASFSFASVGKSVLGEEVFFGATVENLYHMPLIPPLVGIGFFFNQYRGRINIGISFREGLVDEEDREQLRSALQKMY